MTRVFGELGLGEMEFCETGFGEMGITVKTAYMRY